LRFTKGRKRKEEDRPEKKKPQAGKSKKKSKISVEKKFQITNKIP
jgi:hypothetical protein